MRDCCLPHTTDMCPLSSLSRCWVPVCWIGHGETVTHLQHWVRCTAQWPPWWAPVLLRRTSTRASGLQPGHSRASSSSPVGQLPLKPSQNCPAAAGWPDAPPGASGPKPRPQARCGWHCSFGSGTNTTGILKIKGLETVAWLGQPVLGRGQTGTMGGC